MEIRKGSTRIAEVDGGVAFKTPDLSRVQDLILPIIKNSQILLSWMLAPSFGGAGLQGDGINGVLQNLREGSVDQKYPHLVAPTIASLGLVSAQRKAHSLPHNWAEFPEFLQELEKVTKGAISSDSHTFSQIDNFGVVLYEDGIQRICLRDAGGKELGEILENYSANITKIFEKYSNNLSEEYLKGLRSSQAENGQLSPDEIRAMMSDRFEECLQGVSQILGEFPSGFLEKNADKIKPILTKIWEETTKMLREFTNAIPEDQQIITSSELEERIQQIYETFAKAA
ncbi:hypothetical protein HZA38_03600 [Candidatus Peregrinibacteria bacterium]|nr:hypothetical protein [Candidatus Peregrinibacteria bacterium]